MPVSLTPASLHRAVLALSSADPRLGAIIERAGPCGIGTRFRDPPYERLFRAIVYQQLAGRAASTILGRVLALFGDGRVPAPEAVLAMPIERLRGAGLSRNKALAITDLAARTLDGTVPALAEARRLDDTALIERLIVVRGVGRWTAEMLLIFGLGRPDVLPAVDLGIRKGFQRTYRTRGLPAPERVLRDGRRWRPWRTVASWYLWRAADE